MSYNRFYLRLDVLTYLLAPFHTLCDISRFPRHQQIFHTSTSQQSEMTERFENARACRSIFSKMSKCGQRSKIEVDLAQLHLVPKALMNTGRLFPVRDWSIIRRHINISTFWYPLDPDTVKFIFARVLYAFVKESPARRVQ